MTRTNEKWERIYIDGIDVSGYTRHTGTQGWMHAVTPAAALSDLVDNAQQGRAQISIGPLDAILDNTLLGLHTTLKDPATRCISVLYGVGAEPIANDLMFSASMVCNVYTVASSPDFMSVSMPIAGPTATYVNYEKPWGNVILPKSTKTAVNSTKPGVDNGASSLLGGVFVYHLFSSNGTVTLSLEDCATANGTYVAVTGATSGVIDASTTPVGGRAELATNLTIKQYVRWQLAFTSANTATFMVGLIRA
jgi:hypothetical protein